MKTIQYALENIDGKGIATITFDEPNSPVNTMCLQWQEDMTAVAAQVLKDKDAITASCWHPPKRRFLPGPTSKPPCASRLQTRAQRLPKSSA
jgi:3-hydroxyacyl-CoA dehydrogenase/enoyl-CoA hydratase/3-hydroxybutyryl-CoA epimerase